MLAELLRHNGHFKAIQYVAIDMSATNTNGVIDILGNTHVVYNKFNVIQCQVSACDPIRQIKSRADAGKREQLERRRWMRLVLQGVYQWKDVEEARKLFGNCWAWVRR